VRSAIERDDDLAEGGVGGLKLSRMLVRCDLDDDDDDDDDDEC
jgi:hypothetical protein